MTIPTATMSHQSHSMSNGEMQQCINECLNCHSICLNDAATMCLEMGGPHVAAPHLRVMLDCAEICQTSANFMLRGSALHAQTCGVCAQVCAACAASCEQVGGMERCVEACRRCEASCRQMAQMAA